MDRTAKALRRTLAEFAWFYNHVRIHQNLQGLTPMEAWHGRTLADVQQAHAQGDGRWVQALGPADGLPRSMLATKKRKPEQAGQ